MPIAFPLRVEGLPDGARWDMVLRPPFCPLCLRTANRRPLRATEKLLIGFMLFIGIAMVYGRVRASLGDVEPLVAMGVMVIVAFGAPFALDSLMPRERGQTSFWRPIRVEVPRAQASRGHLESLTFCFTSPSYASAFEAINAEALRDGAIKVKRIA